MPTPEDRVLLGDLLGAVRRGRRFSRMAVCPESRCRPDEETQRAYCLYGANPLDPTKLVDTGGWARARRSLGCPRICGWRSRREC